ncbi:MAG: hypothetical protein C4K49_01255 [Candidatus Thorarchaeota archaeon]|nr:MAG: hypothetical protein C4K49_01255 [Candidatus Thorarchaeota archaeon]
MAVLEILAGWFVLSLTGALAPGPLSAACVMQASKHGRLHGVLPMVGHAIVEVGIVAAIIVGVEVLEPNPATIDIILGVGGLVIAGFGLLALKDWRINSGQTSGGRSAQPTPSTVVQATLQGAAVSLLSPYFLIWWFTIGLLNVTLLVGQLQVGVGTIFIAGVLIYLTHVSTDFLFGAFLAVGSDKASKRITVGGINWVNVAIGLIQVALGLWFVMMALL